MRKRAWPSAPYSKVQTVSQGRRIFRCRQHHTVKYRPSARTSRERNLEREQGNHKIEIGEKNIPLPSAPYSEVQAVSKDIERKKS